METLDALTALSTFNEVLNKIGIVVLLIFGIKILVNLYKYNMRMSDFYSSRADIIELAKKEGYELNLLSDIFDATKINFDKNPEFFYKELLDVLKSQIK